MDLILSGKVVDNQGPYPGRGFPAVAFPGRSASYVEELLEKASSHITTQKAPQRTETEEEELVPQLDHGRADTGRSNRHPNPEKLKRAHRPQCLEAKGLFTFCPWLLCHLPKRCIDLYSKPRYGPVVNDCTEF